MDELINELNGLNKNAVITKINSLSNNTLKELVVNMDRLRLTVLMCLLECVDINYYLDSINNPKYNYLFTPQIIKIVVSRIESCKQATYVFGDTIDYKFLKYLDSSLITESLLEELIKKSDDPISIITNFPRYRIVKDFLKSTNYLSTLNSNELNRVLSKLLKDYSTSLGFLDDDMIKCIGAKKIYKYIVKLNNTELSKKIILDNQNNISDVLNYFNIVRVDSKLIQEIFKNEDFIARLDSSNLATILAIISPNDAINLLKNDKILNTISETELNELINTIPNNYLLNEFELFSKDFVLDKLSSKTILKILSKGYVSLNEIKRMIFRMDLNDLKTLMCTLDTDEVFELLTFIDDNYIFDFITIFDLSRYINDYEKAYKLLNSENNKQRLADLLFNEKVYGNNTVSYFYHVIKHNRDFIVTNNTIKLFSLDIINRFNKADILFFSKSSYLVSRIIKLSSAPEYKLDIFLYCYNIIKAYCPIINNALCSMLVSLIETKYDNYLEYFYRNFCQKDYNKMTKEQQYDALKFVKVLLNFDFLSYDNPDAILKSNANIDEFSINEHHQLNHVKSYYLSKCYEITLNEARHLVYDYGDFIANMKMPQDERLKNAYLLLIHMKEIIEDEFHDYTYYQDLISEFVKGNKVSNNDPIDTYFIRDRLSELFSKDYLESLTKIPKKLNKKELDIYESPSNFSYLVSVFNAIGQVKLLDNDYKKSWNTSDYSSQLGISCSYINNHNLGIIRHNNVILGFIPKNDNFIINMGVTDIFSDYSSDAIILATNVKYVDAKTLPSESRSGYNEIVMHRFLNGSCDKEEPSYVLYYKTSDDYLGDPLWLRSKKCASDFGIPIVIIDVLKNNVREDQSIKKSIDKLLKTSNKNPQYIKDILNLMLSNFTGLYTLYGDDEKYVIKYKEKLRQFLEQTRDKIISLKDKNLQLIWFNELKRAYNDEKRKYQPNIDFREIVIKETLLDDLIIVDANGIMKTIMNSCEIEDNYPTVTELDEVFLGGRGRLYELNYNYKKHLFKPALSKNGKNAEPYRAYAAEAAFQIQKLVNPENATLCELCYGDVDGTKTFGVVQKKVKGDAAKTLEFRNMVNEGFKTIPSSYVSQLLKEFVVDYLMCNFDTSADNFIVNSKGQIYGIDKENSLRTVLNMKLDIDENYIEKKDTVYNILFKSALEGNISLNFEEINKIIQSLMEVSTDSYLQIFEPYINSLFDAHIAKASYDDYIYAIIERKKNICGALEELSSRLEKTNLKQL